SQLPRIAAFATTDIKTLQILDSRQRRDECRSIQGVSIDVIPGSAVSRPGICIRFPSFSYISRFHGVLRPRSFIASDAFSPVHSGIRRFGVARAEAMAFRDARGERINEADWAAIEAQLLQAYQSLKSSVGRQAGDQAPQ